VKALGIKEKKIKDSEFADVPEELMEYRPWWIKKEHVKDAKSRRPNNPDYDDTTLLVPINEL
jgi:hypothetical protein